MLSKATIKFVRSLEQKKFRKAENAFIAEGFKSVNDLLAEGWRARLVLATPEWQPPVMTPRNGAPQIVSVTEEELRKASLLQHPQQVLAVFDMPEACSHDVIDGASQTDSIDATKQLVLCLDGVQDPGNLGTIIRTADWFGIRHIICSNGTADAFNPKVVQATMGSIARVRIQYTDLITFIEKQPSGTPVYGTLLDGEDIYGSQLSHNGIIIMGNEGNGISNEVRKHITKKLLIPSFAQNSTTAESLNVSIATAIILSEFQRR